VRKLAIAVAVCALFACPVAQAQIVYDAVSDLAAGVGTTTASVPHTFTGQAFNVSNAGGATPSIVSMIAREFVLGVQNIPFSQVRIQFWGTFDPNATTGQAFSNPIGSPRVFSTGAITTTGNTVLSRNFTFATPIVLPQLTNLGITFNWQSSVDGVTFVDDTNLVTSMRSPVGTMAIPVGQNVTTGTNIYYRNVGGQTDFTFLGSDARALAGQTQATDGLAFQLTAAPVPEPTSLALVGLGLAGFGWRRLRKK